MISRLSAVLLALVAMAPLPARAAEAPYERQLLRLAEVLGSVHYRRNLCGEAGKDWRERIETLLTTGKGKSKPDLGLMKNIVLSSISKLSPSERQAIIGYLKARADRPEPAQAQ